MAVTFAGTTDAFKSRILPQIFLATATGNRKSVEQFGSQRRSLNSTGELSHMAKGTVKWFNDSKGFGFIEQESGGEDVFVHHSAIVADGYRSLAEGAKVEFDINQEPKGLRAANVRISN